MKKLAVVFVVVLCLGALAAYLLTQTGTVTPASPAKGGPGDAPDAALSAEKAPEATRRQREHKDAEAAPALAVTGAVRTPDGKPVAGAVVEAFAVPAADDVPDEDRVRLEFLTKALGKPAAERLMSKGNPLFKAAADPSKMGELMQEGMQLGMELFTDDGGMDALVAMTRMARQLQLEDDGAWPKAGSATSGADGAFRIEGLSAGRVELRARAPGYVKAKQRVTAGDADVRVQIQPGVRICGVVTCDDEPVVGASVLIKGAHTTTGAGGRFEFDAAHVPSETVIVAARGCIAQGQTVELSFDRPAQEMAFALERAGAVAGHVSSVSGGLIAGARVSVGGSGNVFGDMMGMASFGPKFDLPAAPAVTDANGAFEIDGVRSGPTKLRVDADGFVTATVSVEVRKGQTAAVEAMLARESLLTGAVRDEKGTPVPGARVRAEVPPRDAMGGMMASLTGGTFRSVFADANGNFAVHGLSDGERKVRVAAAGFLDLEDSVVLTSATPTVRDFTLREGHRIAGTVTGPDGKPFAGAKIYVSAKPSSNPMAAMTAMFGGRSGSKTAAAESGADGSWSAVGLQEGPFDVRASADGFLDGEEKGVEPGSTNVALALGAAATIRGRVVGVADMKPVAGAKVEHKASGSGTRPALPGRPTARSPRAGRGGRGGGANPFAAMMGGGSSVTCGPDGAFEIKGLEAGDYELTGSMKGFADSAPVAVTCTPGEVTEGVEILLPAGVAVSGRVVEKETGAGVAGALVWAAPAAAGGNPFAAFASSDFTGGAPKAPAGAVESLTDGDGRFVLEGLTPGKLTIEVRVRDHAPQTVAAVEAPSVDLLVQVSAGGNVVGRVTDADGAPVSGAQVMVMRGMGGAGLQQTKSDGNGDFAFERLTPGAYQIMLMDGQSMMPTMAAVTVKDGETARHDFTKKSGGRKVGGAVARDGKPMANAPIMLMGGSVGMKIASTDEQGRFSFDGLDPGDYTVMASSSFIGGGTTSRKVTVGEDGRVDDVRLELSSAKVEGDVIDVESGKGIAGAEIALTESGGKVGSGDDLIASFRGRAIADERGHFIVNDVSNGNLAVRVTAPGYPATTVDPVASGTRNLRVELRNGVELEVHVVGPDGPVPNAMIQTVDAAGREAMSLDMAMTGITRLDGSVKLRLVPGRYTLKVSASNLLPAQVEVNAEAGSVTVRLDAGATLEVAAFSADGVTPLVNAKVTLLDAAGAEIKRGLTMDSFMGVGDRTGQDGRWSRRGLAPGNVTVVVTDTSGHEGRAEATLESNGTRRVDITVK